MLNTLNLKMAADAISVKNLLQLEQNDRFCYYQGTLDRRQVWVKYLCSQDLFWQTRFLNEQSFYKAHACKLGEFINIPQCLKSKEGEYLIMEHLKGTAIAQTRFSKNILLEIDEIEKLQTFLNHLSIYEKDKIDIVFDKGYLLTQIEKVKMAKLINSDQLDMIGNQILNTDFPLAICHGDFLLKNIIKNEEQFYLIDWEYFGASVRFWDLATLWCQFLGKIDFQNKVLSFIPSELADEFKLTVIAILLKEIRLDFNTTERENYAILKQEFDKLI